MFGFHKTFKSLRKGILKFVAIVITGNYKQHIILLSHSCTEA